MNHHTDEDLVDEHLVDEHLVDEHLVDEHLVDEHCAPTVSRCEPCSSTNHDAGDCENHNRPMIARTCNCGCIRRATGGGLDPAPYWSTLTSGG